MQAFVAKRLDHIITVSNDSKQRIVKDFKVKQEKIKVVYNGIDRDIFYPIEGIKRSYDEILFVGNIEDGKKGFATLLKAMTLIKSNVKLVVIDGGAPHRKLTQKIIKKLGVQDKIIFKGTASMDDLVKYYCQAAITIVPSVYEGFGFPAAEAMSCGSPVIASNGGALPEVVGNAGITVPLRDEISLAHAIDSLISDKNKRQELSLAGIKRVETLFSWEQATEKMINLFLSSKK